MVRILSAVLIATSPLPDSAGDAWGEWARWEDFMVPLDSSVLEPAQHLTVDSRVRRDELDRARDIQPSLDLSLDKLRRGLRLPTCAKPTDDAVRVLRLGDAVVLRALLAAEDEQDFTPMVLDLLAMGRRVARCDDAGLLGLTIGVKLARQARALAEWSAGFGLLPPSSRQRLQIAFEAKALGQADLQRAIDQEKTDALALLRRAAPQSSGLYAPQPTEALLAEKVERLRRAISGRGVDLPTVEQELLALVTADEKAALRELGELAQAGLSPKQRREGLGRSQGDEAAHRKAVEVTSQHLPRDQAEALLKRVAPNAMGRLMVQSILGALIRTAAEAVEDLRAESVKLRLPARARTSSWLDDAPPSRRSAGRCVALAPARYRLEHAAQERLNSSGLAGVAELARLDEVQEGGSARGMRMSGFAADSLPASCGFEPGDILRSINGIPVRPERALDVFSSVTAARRAAFVVQRGAQQLELVVGAAE